MAIMDLVRTGVDVGVGMHARQSQEELVAFWELPEHFPRANDTMMTPDHTAFQVRSAGWGGAGIGLACGEGHSTGCHVKVPVRCLCSLLAAHDGAPRTRHML